MADSQDFQVIKGVLITSTSSHYKVQKVLGRGSFGEVAQCRKLTTNETVALKIIKSKQCIQEAKEETMILKTMKERHSDKFNIIRWNCSFSYKGRYCLEFEKLDINLFEFLQKSPLNSLKLKEIRPIVQQLATALEFLKCVGIVHADLKPENIMMVDHLRQPMKVKVIDFGLACNNPEAWTGATLQTQWYRSPEVLLGASFNEAIDLWSLGCIAAEMFLGIALFPGSSTYDMIRHIVYTIGKPPHHLLNAGLYTRWFFCENHTGLEPPQWRFMSKLEVRHFNCYPRTLSSLRYLLKMWCRDLKGEDARADQCDQESFVNLLKKMLNVDPSERITPSQILQHPFITMTHLVSKFNSSLHVKSCVEWMSICQSLSSDDGENAAQEETSNSTAGPDCHPDGGRPDEQPFIKSTIISGENSQEKKRKRDGEDSECGNRSPDTNPKKRRNECLHAEPSGQTSPQKLPLPKRKRDEAVEVNPPAKKKRSVNLKDLLDCLKKLLSNMKEAQTQHLQKRTRAAEEAPGSGKKIPLKTRGREEVCMEKCEPARKVP